MTTEQQAYSYGSTEKELAPNCSAFSYWTSLFLGKMSPFNDRRNSPSETAKEKKHSTQTLQTTLSCGLNAEIKRQTLCNDSVAQEWNKCRCNWNNDT